MRFLFCLPVLLILLTGQAAAFSVEAQALVDEAAANCADFEDGTFDPGEARHEVTLRQYAGSLTVEIIDESAYSCSSAASLFCGSGGCMLHVIAQGQVTSWQVTGWQVVEWGPDSILLLGRDGGWCGGAGAEVCYEAVVWSNGRPLTVGPVPAQR